MSTTTYINFSAIDYKGQNSLSSYAISLTPFRFVPDLDNSDKSVRVVWNFGDGTIVKSFSASKYYTFPGIYNVEMVVYNCDNNAAISTFTKNLTIYDYTPFTFSVSGLSSLEVPCGRVSGPLVFTATYPPYQTASSVYFEVSGSGSANYWVVKDSKYGHLDNFYAFYTPSYNYALSAYQYTPISKIDFITHNLYAKIDASNIVSCLSTDSQAFVVGAQGETPVYYKDDKLTNLSNLKFYFDKTNNLIPATRLSKSYLNNLAVSLSSKVLDNVPVALSITSNGLDGEKTPITSFDINPIKFYDTQIPFTVKLKDSTWCSVKNFNTIQLSSLSFRIPGLGTTQYSISSLNTDYNGAFRGYMVFPNATTVLSNLTLTVSGTLVNTLLSSYRLSGTSTPFSVYPKKYYDIYKKGETFDAEQTLKDLRFQETMLDKEVLFGDFLGQILGDVNSEYTTIGKALYEKIQNFVQNTQDVDTCGVEYLHSLAEFVGYNDIGEEQYSYPINVLRWMDLFSIDSNKLVGTLNKFNENLDIQGRAAKTEYGINIGNKLNPYTYTVSPSTPIVALEKFSNTYTLLNTYQPLSGLTNYALSSYSSDWGWPLVLPSPFNFLDIEKYYLFFEYNARYDNTVLDGVIDFDNTQTTILQTVSSQDLTKTNGIYEFILLDTLYQSLSLT